MLVKKKILGKEFFGRSPVIVARELLGKFLVRKLNGKTIAQMIVETEAYWGRGDMSSHARMGQTERNRAMFGPPGHWYIYFTYGMHHCMNIVTGIEGEASAVLIRGLHDITGPARICRDLEIDKKLYGKRAERITGLWIEDRGFRIKNKELRIKRTPRINVSGNERAKAALWRFVLSSSS